MSRKQKIDTSFLVFKPNVFVERRLDQAIGRQRIAKSVYISFNIISFISVLVLLAFSTIIFSKIVTTGTPDWYFTVTTGIAAFITFMTSMANFFYVKEKQEQYKSEIEYIESEIAYFQLGLKDYTNKKTKEFVLFKNVTSFIGFTMAKEDENE